MSNTNKSLKDIIKEEYKKCLLDPVHFMKKYCQIQHPQKGKIPFHLYPFQEDALRDLRDFDYNVILKSRQLGISTLSANVKISSGCKSSKLRYVILSLLYIVCPNLSKYGCNNDSNNNISFSVKLYLSVK
jgi:hypothetical protein